MLEVQLENIKVAFDEVVKFTEEEIINISKALTGLDRDVSQLNTSDMPRVRELINDSLDRLNKAGKLTDEMVANNTYSIEPIEKVYMVESNITLSRVDSVSASSKEEAVKIVKNLRSGDSFTDEITKLGDVHNIQYEVIGEE